MEDNILFTFILFAGFTSTFASHDWGLDPFVGFLIGVIVFFVIIVVVTVAVCVYCRRTRGHTGQVCQPAPPQRTTIHIHSPLPCGQTGYNGTVNSPVVIMTSNVTPGTTQQMLKPVAPLPPEQREERRVMK
ncbi:uncharacterized protein LOC132718568 [Ruditapes philippinarum]|uniref:uncharacterized protein LOC132718568 n=1 Tax=Ruditapes philippinarum TaxID=129788 RepID=UPI00295A9023|nr:uncharacterized protein LOC132718568 [Ruditapes philippinarum]